MDIQVGPIAIEQLEGEYQRKHANNNAIFQAEFKVRCNRQLLNRILCCKLESPLAFPEINGAPPVEDLWIPYKNIWSDLVMEFPNKKSH